MKGRREKKKERKAFQVMDGWMDGMDGLGWIGFGLG
jgi:hypothetical protein